MRKKRRKERRLSRRKVRRQLVRTVAHPVSLGSCNDPWTFTRGTNNSNSKSLHISIV